ncbi:MAG: molybdopterin-dependent oxidoreductase [Candidatus Thalassarchaeaceae archaeon]|jgi:4-hydroxybenzoyl-CoA reductase alpha subunit|nr:molybdopterin-dependent oxidoreductase [Candidatus Thalassarchaeaceae archaeon]MDP7311927.1 molybdopterin-dependent oxidoreductase [Candidatus Thalassarchaeaceae archaeon]
MSDEKEMVGYRQQPGKLPFARPGSGGKNQFSELRDEELIPESRGGNKEQKWGTHRHDELVTSSAIGKKTALIDSRWKVTGQAKYGDDIRLSNELVGKILRSPHHFARIISIDTSAAEELDGVIAVATGADSSAKFGVLPVTKDEHALAVNMVRHVGDLVACVAAEDEATALQALQLIEVDYEVLDSIHNMKDGLKNSNNPIHDRGKYHIGESNIQKRVFQEFGEVSAMEEKAVASHKSKWTFAGVNHGFTEPHAVVANWDPRGRLTLYTPQQVPHYLHRALAEVLDIPMHQINVYRTFVGGGFGGKSDPFPHEMCAAILARKTGRPVRINFDREEVFLVNRGRHPSHIEMDLHSDTEGRLCGITTDALIDGGAFASFGHVTTYYNGVLHTAPYEIGGFHYTGARVWTNKPASGAMRGHGAVNSRCAVEVGIDDLTTQLKVDPITFRLANLLPPMSATITGFRITSIGMRECLEKVRESSGWDEKFRNLPLGHGIGVGCGFFISGSGLPIHWDPNKFPHATVHLKIDMDGGVTIHTGAAEIGQGSDTVVAQSVAEVLGLPLDMIRVRSQESDTAPVDLGSYSSRVTFMNANAAISAAMNIREKLLLATEEITGSETKKLVIGDRRIYDKTDPAVGVSYLEALHKAQEDKGALVSSGAYRTPPMGRAHKGAAAGLAPAYSFSAYVAEVKVDVETGQTKVLNVWAAHDCGKALNPLAVEGQIIGSCHMGMGQVLSEEMVYGRNGDLMNANLLDYKIPTIHEMPNVFPIIVESNDPEGPFGAKEAGEGPLLPILPAVCNAVYDAIGVRVDELPITPDRMHKNIEKLCKAEGVDGPLELESPRIKHSELQKTLETRAIEHNARDMERRMAETIEPYHNGALFGYDGTIPPEEQSDEWMVSVTPTKEYLDNPRLAGSAWEHIERRHRGDT